MNPAPVYTFVQIWSVNKQKNVTSQCGFLSLRKRVSDARERNPKKRTLFEREVRVCNKMAGEKAPKMAMMAPSRLFLRIENPKINAATQLPIIAMSGVRAKMIANEFVLHPNREAR